MLALLVAASGAGESCRAEDRVLLQLEGQSSRISVAGVVLDYTGQALTLQTRVGTGVKRYARSEIVEVATTYSERHQQGRDLFARGQIAEAEKEFSAALDQEDRVWVRREILASQVKCALWRGDYRQAAVRFQAIIQSDPDTLYFGLMPLVWTADGKEQLALAEARGWLQSPSAATRLIAASWLWGTTSDHDTALLMLRQLATTPEQNLQRLAQAQLWRERLKLGDVTPTELRRWETFADELPEDLRAGPLYLIGAAYRQHQDEPHAAAAWLWVPFHYPEQRQLAARALASAAESLARSHDFRAARALLAEFEIRYAETPAAELAQRVQQQLAQGAGKSP